VAPGHNSAAVCAAGLLNAFPKRHREDSLFLARALLNHVEAVFGGFVNAILESKGF
jgi:hypothetical protein